MASALLDVGPTIGPLFIGSILNWMFMGVLGMQYYSYYQTFPTDKLSVRILVNVLFLLDVVQTVTSTHFAWFFIITTWGNPDAFTFVPWSASMIPILCGIITATVQIVYAWRIWVLAPSRFFRVVAAVIVGLAFAQGTSAIVAGAMTLHSPSLAELAQVHPEVMIHKVRLPLWLSTTLCSDLIIVAAMTFILTRAKRESGWSPTETMLTALIHRIVQTGATSAICAAIDLAMFVAYPATNFHFAPAYILGKVYTNSLMLTLNLRRQSAQSMTSQSGVLSGLSFRVVETRCDVTRTIDVEVSPAEVWNQKGSEEYMSNKDGLIVGDGHGEQEGEHYVISPVP